MADTASDAGASRIPRPGAARALPAPTAGPSDHPSALTPRAAAPSPSGIPQRSLRVPSGGAPPTPSRAMGSTTPATPTTPVTPATPATPATPSARRRPRPPAEDGAASTPRGASAGAARRRPSPALAPPAAQPPTTPRSPARTGPGAQAQRPPEPAAAPAARRPRAPTSTLGSGTFVPAPAIAPVASPVPAPPHVRARLRLLHRLGSVLALSPAEVARAVDAPALLAHVERAHALRHTGGAGAAGAAGAAPSSLPLPRAEGMRASRSGGVLGIIRRLGKRAGGADAPPAPGLLDAVPDVFGVALDEAPAGSWCASLIGGQRHELPLVVFTVIEEIYRRGMTQPGIFRLAGDGARIAQLTRAFNLAPLYGDSLALAAEPVHNLAGLVKRYVRDLPGPPLAGPVFAALASLCFEGGAGASAGAGTGTASTAGTAAPASAAPPEAARVHAATILLQLLPRPYFSLVVYLLAFLGQLPLFPENRLNIDSISIIFGPALCAPRGVGVAGLGPASTAGPGAGGAGPAEPDADAVSDLVSQSQAGLAWLLRNWGSISQNVLDVDEADDDDDDGANATLDTAVPATPVTCDAGLLSPIDLRERARAEPSPATERAATRADPAARATPAAPTAPATPALEPDARSASSASESSVLTPRSSAGSDTEAPAAAAACPGPGSRVAATEPGARRVPARSASFTSLSGLVKKGGQMVARMDRRSAQLDTPRLSPSPSRTGTAPAAPAAQDSVTAVLGSLHHLLVSRDAQIARDARELAILRQTLLETDRQLRAARGEARGEAPHLARPGRGLAVGDAAAAPHITVTSSPSAHLGALGAAGTVGAAEAAGAASAGAADFRAAEVRAADDRAAALQGELDAALAALSSASARAAAAEARTADATRDADDLRRALGARDVDVSRLELELALERAAVRGLADERDVARRRLEQVKTTLFAVA